MNEDSKYSKEQLEKYWSLSYRELVFAAKDGLRLPRFVMQAKVAMETRRLIWMTFFMALATFFMAVATVLSIIL